MDIPLARGDYHRSVAKEARARLRNRYFEQNPILNKEPTALIARPGMHRWKQVGDGPIRGLYDSPGSFNGDLFVASGEQIFRLAPDGTETLIGTLSSDDPQSAVTFAATAYIGDTPEFLFVCAGSTLMCYMEQGYANADVSGSPANNDVIVVGTIYYRFTTGSVDAGTPAGTSANPWLVAVGSSDADSWRNFATALGATGVAGTDYSTALVPNPSATSSYYTGAGVTVRALQLGAAGDGIAVSTTGANITWSSATLEDGGAPYWFPVQVPEDYGIIDIGYCSSHVVCVPTQGQGINGRFYWIKPGEITIDPLDFATAERAPDPIHGVVVMNDQFWLPGSSTTEVWYFTGNIDSPVARMQGVVYDRGCLEGTAIKVGDTMITVDPEGAVFQIGGQGGIRRISRPDIEQRIREAIARAAAS